MAVREFDGIDDVVVCLPGATVGLAGGPSTLAVLVKRNNTSSGSFIVSAANATTTSSTFGQQVGMWVKANTDVPANNLQSVRGSSDSIASPAIPWVNADGWVLIVSTKASGSVAPRFHFYKLSDSSIVRQNGAIAQADAPALTGVSRWEFGKGEFVDKFAGRFAAAAVWDVALSDAQVDELYADRMTADWLANSGAAPKALWQFAQQAAVLKIADLTGGGADQEAILGTTPVEGDDPPGWTFIDERPRYSTRSRHAPGRSR